MAERAAGEAAECGAMMHKRGLPDPSLAEHRAHSALKREFLADVLRPFHDAIVKALAPHFHDVFEGEEILPTIRS